MTEVEQKFVNWRFDNHPCYTASARQGFHAGYAAGAESMRERAAAVIDLHGYDVRGPAIIDALSPTPEENTETQKPETENLPK